MARFVMNQRPRKIIHVDMDAFFASVEQHDDPALRGKPVIVGGVPGGRGVVAAASYEARAFGIRSAMPSGRAARICPHAIFVRPRFERYKEVSNQVMAIFESFAEKVEPLSLDEAYLDVTENKRGIEFARDVAKIIKEEIFCATGLTASAGVASNKFLAKIASEQKKPNGLTIISPERVEQFLRDLPVRQFPGVGPVTEKKLHALGILTASHLRLWREDDLVRELGSFGSWLFRVCRGEDDREVNGHRDRQSLGAEDTFREDLVGLESLEKEVDRIAGIVADRLRSRGLAGRTVTLKVTFSDFEKITRSLTADRPISEVSDVSAIASALLTRTAARTGRPVRLIGISLSGFNDPPPSQLLLPFTVPLNPWT